jgi:hypothetical protein
MKNGNCYEAAANYLLDHAAKLGPDARLVHGLVTGQGPVAGIRFGHAWVEVGDMAIDPSNGRLIRLLRQHYYFLGQIRENELTRYTHAEIRGKMLDFLHYGPWKTEEISGFAGHREASIQVQNRGQKWCKKRMDKREGGARGQG